MAVKKKDIKLGTKLQVLTAAHLPPELKAEKGHILQVHFVSDAYGLDDHIQKYDEALIIKVDNMNTEAFENIVIQGKGKKLKGVKLYKENRKLKNCEHRENLKG
ncbi:MAG: hypothetical protein KBA53_04395 [Thermoclostridium sp.]|nr:hypothetical protein [Thermoclostridium sp.]